MTTALDVLGLSKEEAQQKAIDRVAELLLVEFGMDSETGEELPNESPFARRLRALIDKKISASLDKLANEQILPNVGAFVEKMILQPTSAYGEKKGPTRTLAEEMVTRAEEYMQQQVDSRGNPAQQYSNDYHQPRIVWMVEQYLGNSVKEAIDTNLKRAHAKLAQGIEATVKQALATWSNGFEISVSGKRSR